MHIFSRSNVACPKYEIPLLITDVMIDNTYKYERIYFMDGFSGYNWIKMHSENEKHTTFRTPLRYTVIQ